MKGRRRARGGVGRGGEASSRVRQPVIRRRARGFRFRREREGEGSLAGVERITLI